MASEKQIAANRTNAQRSTGPRTILGKSKSSRNSFRHGLSGRLPIDVATSAKVGEIARALVAEQAWATEIGAAMEFAEAQIELLHIRAIRAHMLRSVDLAKATADQLERVVALDRYERYAHTKRRQAASHLEV